MQNQLKLGDAIIGMVTVVDADFPNIWGAIVFDASLANADSEETRRIAEFVELNRKCTRLADIEHEQDVSAVLDAVNQQLESYNDYVESEEWMLVTPAGVVTPICCPIFRGDGELVWRWRHGDSTSGN